MGEEDWRTFLIRYNTNSILDWKERKRSKVNLRFLGWAIG